MFKISVKKVIKEMGSQIKLYLNLVPQYAKEFWKKYIYSRKNYIIDTILTQRDRNVTSTF